MARNPMPKQTFRAWLKRQPAKTTIGISRHWSSCPLASACNATGYANVRVSSRISYTTGNPQPHKPIQWHAFDLLPWQRHFLDIIDRSPGQNPITREDALEILATV